MIGNLHTHLHQSHRATVAQVQRRMDEAEAGSAERRAAALELCRLRGLVTDANGLESVNEMGETLLLQVLCPSASSSSMHACCLKRARLSVCDLLALLYALRGTIVCVTVWILTVERAQIKRAERRRGGKSDDSFFLQPLLVPLYLTPFHHHPPVVDGAVGITSAGGHFSRTVHRLLGPVTARTQRK